jgi:hypothetical protein
MPPTSSPTLDRVLFDRDEGCCGLYRGLKISVWGTWLHDDLLAESERAVREAAQLYPQGLAVLTTFRADPRFPLSAEFASNFSNTARTLRECLPFMRATACVPMYDGYIATTMRITVNALSRLVAHKIPQRVFASRVEAMSWLATEVPWRRASVRDDLLAARAVDDIFERRKAGRLEVPVAGAETRRS